MGLREKLGAFGNQINMRAFIQHLAGCADGIANALDTADAVVVLDVFEKKTEKTPDAVIQNCRRRWKLYEASQP